MISFSILIPIYNRLSITREGLRALVHALDRYALYGKGDFRFDIIVIDDGSTDGSSAWISENYPAIHLLQGNGNLWWSGAINKGAKYALDQLSNDYLLLWNDDIIPDKDFFICVARLFTAHSFENSIIGSKILYKGTDDRIWSAGGYFNKTSGKYGLYNKEEDISGEFLECDWQPGMGTFIRTSLIRQHGIFWDDAAFPQYHGDSDLTLRYKAKGVKILTCPDLVIYNNTDSTGIGKITSFKKLWASLTSIRSSSNISKRLLFYKRHGTFPLAYFGFLKTYALYIGGFLKRKMIHEKIA